jgi:hypothetical protein
VTPQRSQVNCRDMYWAGNPTVRNGLVGPLNPDVAVRIDKHKFTLFASEPDMSDYSFTSSAMLRLPHSIVRTQLTSRLQTNTCRYATVMIRYTTSRRLGLSPLNRCRFR